MEHGHMPIGRRERAKQDKRERIMAAARELLAQHGVSGVTIAADRPIGPMLRSAPYTCTHPPRRSC
jgi:hypothetical protein